MPITIVDSDLDRRIDALIQAQPVKASRASMATAILERACEAFEQSGDADAWRFPARVSDSAQGDSNGAGSIRPAPITSASNGASSKSAAANSEAGAAVKAA